MNAMVSPLAHRGVPLAVVEVACRANRSGVDRGGRVAAHQLVPHLLHRRPRDADLGDADALAQGTEDEHGDVIHRSTADVRHLDPLALGDTEAAQLGVAIVATLPAVGDDAAQLVVVGAAIATARAGRCPAVAKRQVYSLPSTPRRARVQSPQNGRLTDVITPRSPAPSANR